MIIFILCLLPVLAMTLKKNMKSKSRLRSIDVSSAVIVGALDLCRQYLLSAMGYRLSAIGYRLSVATTTWYNTGITLFLLPLQLTGDSVLSSYYMASLFPIPHFPCVSPGLHPALFLTLSFWSSSPMGMKSVLLAKTVRSKEYRMPSTGVHES